MRLFVGVHKYVIQYIVLFTATKMANQPLAVWLMIKKVAF